jgi:hypothetical protein
MIADKRNTSSKFGNHPRKKRGLRRDRRASGRKPRRTRGPILRRHTRSVKSRSNGTRNRARRCEALGLGPILGRNVDTLHWGTAIEYSTYYLTRRFTGAPPKEEPLNQLVPLIEFNFDSPVSQKTAATMNPGLAYVGQTYQVAVGAIVPLNTEAGRGLGVRTQLLLFLDDLAPSVFGKPLLSP